MDTKYLEVSIIGKNHFGAFWFHFENKAIFALNIKKQLFKK